MHMPTTSSIARVFSALFLLCTATLQAQVIISNARIVGGATATRLSNGGAVYGSVAQPILYNVELQDTVEKRVGIWSEASFIQSQYEKTTIEVPSIAVETGDTARVSVQFTAPCHFFTTDHVRPWLLTLSFNRSMIEPVGYESLVDDGTRYIVSYRGSTSASGGTLSTIALPTRLGNDTITDVLVESFEWLDVPRQGVTAIHGSITQRGLCITDGSTRLVFERNAPQVIASPNPSNGPMIGIRSYSPSVQTGVLRVLDLQGSVMHQINGVPASKDAPMTNVIAPELPAGTYVIQLLLPTGAASTTFVRLP